LNWVEFEPVTVAGAVGITRVEAEDVSFASGARTGSDQEGRGYVSRYTGGAMVDEQLWFEKAGRYTLTVMAKNEAYAPVHIEGRLDGALLGTLEYGRGDESWSRRSLEVRVAEPGTHRFTLEFAGPWIEVDYYGYIDWFEFRPVDGS
jgi:hypothetical protein